LRDALAPLREREFRLLFLGRTISFAGSAMAPVALAFAVLELTGSKTDLGLVLAARSVPQIVFLLVGGVWADRLSRHRVMVASNVLSGAAQAAVAVLLLTGRAEIWHLAGFAAVNGFASAFFFPASQGVVPQTVPAAALQSANSLLRLGLHATAVTGAALGGLLVAATSPGTAIAVDAASYVLAALFLARMRLPSSVRLEAPRFFGELHEGWREFRSRTWLWVIVLQAAFVNAAWVAADSVLGPVVANEELGGAAAWGVILACQSAGLIVGGLLLLRLQPRRMLLTATFGMLLALPVLVALAVPLPVVAVAAAGFVAGLGLEIFGVLWDTTMQQEIPPEKLSRLYSYDALGSFVLIPVGLAVVGPVAAAVGTSETLLLAAGLNLAATLAVLAVHDVRTLARRPTAPDRQPESEPEPALF
jgi:predicted MFS family arabinose efflux permease